MNQLITKQAIISSQHEVVLITSHQGYSTQIRHRATREVYSAKHHGSLFAALKRFDKVAQSLRTRSEHAPLAQAA